MFQFTTTTVINSNFEHGYTPTGVKKKDEQYALWSAQEEQGNTPANLNIKRHLRFLKPNVLSITKAPYTKPVFATATLDLDELEVPTEDSTFRIALYIKLSQSSANSYYANDLVFKGKPLYIEFPWKKGETTGVVAKRIKDIAKKYMLMVYEKDLVKVSFSGATVTISAIDEYQRFVKVDVEKFYKGDAPMFGEYKAIASATLPKIQEYNEDTRTLETVTNPEHIEGFDLIQGVEGFGTYQWILKNLRLPTAARTSWTAINADEVPIIGAKYDEYIVRYCVNRGIMGGDAVGEVTKSVTTHVFYVNQNVSKQFEEALGYIGTVKTIWGNEAQKEDNSTD